MSNVVKLCLTMVDTIRTQAITNQFHVSQDFSASVVRQAQDFYTLASTEVKTIAMMHAA